ncbi:MAG: hypothetical protein OIF50_14735 [Flavobacteriaceae bacterium]|nr:hypothetical protein [Flavobacteriaceae bacterium]
MQNKIPITIFYYFLLLLLWGASSYFAYAWYTANYRYRPSQGAFHHKANHIDPSLAVEADNFQVCNEDFILEYYYPRKFPYQTDKDGFRTKILQAYAQYQFDDTAYIYIRFVVNCKGEPGRYLLETYTIELQPTTKHQKLGKTLLEITQTMKDWEIGINQFNNPYDYNMYIGYRIEHGKIVAILP